MRTSVRMGRASQPHEQFNRAVRLGEFRLALSIAKHKELTLDIRQSLDLTILAAKARQPIFDPMAVRWIRAADDRGKLKLRELTWLGQTFEAVRRGDERSAEAITQFLARGRR